MCQVNPERLVNLPKPYRWQVEGEALEHRPSVAMLITLCCPTIIKRKTWAFDGCAPARNWTGLRGFGRWCLCPSHVERWTPWMLWLHPGSHSTHWSWDSSPGISGLRAGPCSPLFYWMQLILWPIFKVTSHIIFYSSLSLVPHISYKSLLLSWWPWHLGGFGSLCGLALPRRKSSGVPTRVNLEVAHTVPWWEKKQKQNRVKCLWPKKYERSPCLVLLCWGRQVVVKKKVRKKEKGVLSQVCQHFVVWECFVYLWVIQLRIMKSTSCWFLQPLFEVTSGRSADATVRLQESSFYVLSFDESKNSLTHRWFPCPPDFQIHLSPGNFA